MAKHVAYRNDGSGVGRGVVLLTLMSCGITACHSGALDPGGSPEAGAAGAGGFMWVSPPAPRLPPSDVVPGTFDPAGRKLDVLFLIDNSSSMATLQARLLAGFP